MPRPSRESSPSRKPDTSSSRYAQVGRRESTERASFKETMAAMLGCAIDTVIDDGDAILISRTSDGGAISIQILHDGGRHAMYPVIQAELDAIMEQLGTP